MFAIVSIGNKQFKVKAGSFIRAPRMWKNEPQDKVYLPIYALGGEKDFSIEKSELEKAAVTATVLRHGKGKKFLVFKKKRRKGYRRTKGIRTPFTELHISEIKLPSGETLRATLKKSVKKKETAKAPQTTAKREESTKKTQAVTKTIKKEEAVKKPQTIIKQKEPTTKPQVAVKSTEKKKATEKNQPATDKKKEADKNLKATAKTAKKKESTKKIQAKAKATKSPTVKGSKKKKS